MSKEVVGTEMAGLGRSSEFRSRAAVPGLAVVVTVGNHLLAVRSVDVLGAALEAHGVPPTATSPFWAQDDSTSGV